MGGACSTNGEKRNSFRLLEGNPEGKMQVGRPRCQWLDNVKIKMELGETRWGLIGLDWFRIGISSLQGADPPSRSASLYVTKKFPNITVFTRARFGTSWRRVIWLHVPAALLPWKEPQYPM
jgi:hypothetical protein